MKILLIGASSYVGARLCFDLKNKFNVVGTYSNNSLSKNFIHLDITDKEEVNKVVKNVKPDIILHVANNASAKWVDANKDKAILLNQTSTEYIVEAANKIKAKIIYLSTMGAIKPSNLYGKTKSASEDLVKKTDKGYLILRPSLVIGYSPNTTNDRPFNRLLKNLDKGIPAKYDTSWKFQPTYIKHISEVIEACINRNIFNETIVIAVPKLVSRYDYTRDILKPFNIPVEPFDARDVTFEIFEDKLEKLKKYNLPQYTYKQIIKEIIKEIENRKKFILS